MKKIVSFVMSINKKIQKDNVMGLANELTYKILLSSFPFLTFLMSLLGFMNLKIDKFLLEFSDMMPEQLMGVFNVFVKEVLYERNVSILSISLLISIYSSSGGFRSFMRGINRAYRVEKKRNFFVRQLVSIGLVFIFVIAIVSSLALSVSGEFISNVFGTDQIFGMQFGVTFSILKYIVLLVILFLIIALIYKFSCCKKIRFKNIIPGAVFTVLLWIISSKLYGIYIENFTNYSKIYGSIAGVFILLIWLNMISLLLLIGVEINIFLENRNSNKVEISK